MRSKRFLTKRAIKIVFLDINPAERKTFEDLAIKMKNFLFNGQIKEKNLGSKLGEKSLNCNRNTREKNRVFQFYQTKNLLTQKEGLERKTL